MSANSSLSEFELCWFILLSCIFPKWFILSITIPISYDYRCIHIISFFQAKEPSFIPWLSLIDPTCKIVWLTQSFCLLRRAKILFLTITIDFYSCLYRDLRLEEPQQNDVFWDPSWWTSLHVRIITIEEEFDIVSEKVVKQGGNEERKRPTTDSDHFSNKVI